MSHTLRKLNNPMCNGNIMFEPRLAEYLKKKAFYRDNGIEPCISIEKEYSITNDDLQKIKMFFSGDKNIYHPKNNVLNKEFKTEKQYFPSIKFRNTDKRMKIFNFKEPKMNLPTNRGMFAPNKPSDDYYDDPLDNMDKITSSSTYGPTIMDGRDFRSDQLENHPVSQRTYFDPPNTDYKAKSHGFANYPPILDYKVPIYNEPLDTVRKCYKEGIHKTNVNDIIGKLDTYTTNLSPTYSSNSEMDNNTKIVIPSVASKGKKCLDVSSYKPVPYMGYGRGGSPNTEDETELMLGSPSKTAKSYGYTNPHEHYFDYISDDMQIPEHTVMPFPRGGLSTRLDNHDTARKYTREILN